MGASTRGFRSYPSRFTSNDDGCAYKLLLFYYYYYRKPRIFILPDVCHLRFIFFFFPRTPYGLCAAAIRTRTICSGLLRRITAGVAAAVSSTVYGPADPAGHKFPSQTRSGRGLRTPVSGGYVVLDLVFTIYFHI